MSALDPGDVDRFNKLLGLLGSNHDGERAVAAKKATDFLSARHLVWADIGEMLKRPPVVIQPQPFRHEPARPSRSHQMDARRCLQSPVAWKPHERKFLEQMATQRQAPTDKQEAWLDGLNDRVTRYYRERGDADF